MEGGKGFATAGKAGKTAFLGVFPASVCYYCLLYDEVCSSIIGIQEEGCIGSDGGSKAGITIYIQTHFD